MTIHYPFGYDVKAERVVNRHYMYPLGHDLTRASCSLQGILLPGQVIPGLPCILGIGNIPGLVCGDCTEDTKACVKAVMLIPWFTANQRVPHTLAS